MLQTLWLHLTLKLKRLLIEFNHSCCSLTAYFPTLSHSLSNMSRYSWNFICILKHLFSHSLRKNVHALFQTDKNVERKWDEEAFCEQKVTKNKHLLFHIFPHTHETYLVLKSLKLVRNDDDTRRWVTFFINYLFSIIKTFYNS